MIKQTNKQKNLIKSICFAKQSPTSTGILVHEATKKKIKENKTVYNVHKFEKKETAISVYYLKKKDL